MEKLLEPALSVLHFHESLNADVFIDFPQTYHIHINGVRHCVVRFRQLHALHEQLRRELPFPSASAAASRPVAALPPFPPKKLLPLTVPQLEERRATLEKYLQRLSQERANE